MNRNDEGPLCQKMVWKVNVLLTERMVPCVPSLANIGTRCLAEGPGLPDDVEKTTVPALCLENGADG